MTNRMFLVFWMLLGLVVFAVSPHVASAWPVHSRPKPKELPKEPSAESVTLNGVVQSITSTEIEMLVHPPADKGNAPADKGKPNKNAPHGKWTVLTHRDTPIHVTGEATPDYLHPGLMVQFAATGQAHEVKDQIHELSIVTPAQRTRHTGSAAAKPVSKGNAAIAPPAGSEPQKVIGQLGHLHDNKWSVHGRQDRADRIGRRREIAVAFTGSRHVKPGDKVVVQGEMVHGKRAPQPATCG